MFLLHLLRIVLSVVALHPRILISRNGLPSPHRPVSPFCQMILQPRNSTIRFPAPSHIAPKHLRILLLRISLATPIPTPRNLRYFCRRM
ncbi:hypothetical protein BC830DRAFT_1121932, partial [Chytriomyces sp. MP71]